MVARPAGTPAPPRTARPAATALFLLNGATFGSWVSRIPDVSARSGLSEAQLGLALFGVAAGAVGAMPLVAPAVRRWGSRRVSTVAVVAFCASLPLLGMARSGLGLAATLVVFGATNGVLDVAMNDNGGRVERHLGRPIMGTLHAGFSGGAALGALAGGAAASAGLAPFPHFALVAAVLATVGAVAGPRLADLPDPPEALRGGRRRRVGASGPLTVVVVVALCAAFAEGAVADWGALYLVDDLGTSTALGAGGFVAFSTAMVVGRLSQDRIVHRVGEDAVRRVGATAGAAAMAVALLTGDPRAAVVALGAVGLGLAAVFPVTMSAAGRVPGVAPAQAVAVVSATAYGALLAGPPLIGLLAEATTLRAALWTVVGALAATALLRTRGTGDDG